MEIAIDKPQPVVKFVEVFCSLCVCSQELDEVFSTCRNPNRK